MPRRKNLKKKSRLLKALRNITQWLWEEFKIVLLIILGVYMFFNWLDINLFEKVGEKLGSFGTHDKLQPLKENEEAKLTVNTPARRVHVQTKDRKTKTYEGVRKVEATQLTDGTYTLKAKQLGLTLEPGLVLGVGDGLGVGPDVEFAYWKAWSLAAGFTVPVNNRRLDRIKGHLALVYMPGLNIASNTGLWAGIDTNRSPVAGIRIRF